MDYRNYRVKSPVKSFRDLEVYQKTIQLSDEITSLSFLGKEQFEDDNKENLFRERFREDKSSKEILDNLLTRYQNQKIKVLNLRKAWNRVFTNYPQNEPGKYDWRK